MAVSEALRGSLSLWPINDLTVKERNNAPIPSDRPSVTHCGTTLLWPMGFDLLTIGPIQGKPFMLRLLDRIFRNSKLPKGYVTHSCGHVTAKELIYRNRNRIEVCPFCWEDHE